MLLQIEEIKKESKESLHKYEAICDEKIDMFKKEVYKIIYRHIKLNLNWMRLSLRTLNLENITIY
jgi:hypothetical protein